MPEDTYTCAYCKHWSQRGAPDNGRCLGPDSVFRGCDMEADEYCADGFEKREEEEATQ